MMLLGHATAAHDDRKAGGTLTGRACCYSLFACSTCKLHSGTLCTILRVDAGCQHSLTACKPSATCRLLLLLWQQLVNSHALVEGSSITVDHFGLLHMRFGLHAARGWHWSGFAENNLLQIYCNIGTTSTSTEDCTEGCAGLINTTNWLTSDIR